MEMIRLCNTHQDYHDCRNIPAAYVSRYQNHPRLQFTRSYSNCEHQCCACQMHSLWLSPENLVRAYSNVLDRERLVHFKANFCSSVNYRVHITSVDGSSHSRNLQLIDIGFCKGRCNSPLVIFSFYNFFKVSFRHRRPDLFHCSASEYEAIRIVYSTETNPIRKEQTINRLKIKSCNCKARVSCE